MRVDDYTVYAAFLAKARQDCDNLRWDLQRLGFLTMVDPLWTLLEEMERELSDALWTEINRLGEGDADSRPTKQADEVETK